MRHTAWARLPHDGETDQRGLLVRRVLRAQGLLCPCPPAPHPHVPLQYIALLATTTIPPPTGASAVLWAPISPSLARTIASPVRAIPARILMVPPTSHTARVSVTPTEAGNAGQWGREQVRPDSTFGEETTGPWQGGAAHALPTVQ